MARIMVVGSGAREHAILAALARSPSRPSLLCFGSANNPGISSLCTAEGCAVGKITDPAAVVEFARARKATLAVIGPEAPLASGVADALRAAGVPVVGPSAAMAQIESSKGFALELLRRHGVAGVPLFKEFTSMDGAREFLEQLGEGVRAPPKPVDQRAIAPSPLLPTPLLEHPPTPLARARGSPSELRGQGGRPLRR
jgi:phosphoribosylamine--glycine ligase